MQQAARVAIARAVLVTTLQEHADSNRKQKMIKRSTCQLAVVMVMGKEQSATAVAVAVVAL